LYVRGRVVDPRGEPVPQATVDVRSWTGSTFASFAFTDAHGSFVVGPCIDVELGAVAHGVGSGARSTRERVRAGGPEVVLRLRPGCILSGTTVDASTGEACAVTAILSPHEAAEPHGQRMTAPSIGFRFDALEPGVYDLFARTSDGLAALVRDIELAPGQELRDLNLRLEAGARLRIRYTGSAKFAYVRVTADRTVVASTNVDTQEATVLVVPAGELTVSLNTGREPRVQRVQVSAGDVRDLEFAEE
jgi:hypothetical protein